MPDPIRELTTEGRFRQKVERLVTDGHGKGYPLKVHNALRTLSQQKANVKSGVSKTLRSKHLPGMDGFARAADVIDARYGWGAPKHVWVLIGRLALTKGLVWGGLWGLPRGMRKKLEAFLLDQSKPFDPEAWEGKLGWDVAHVESATCRWSVLTGKWTG